VIRLDEVSVRFGSGPRVVDALSEHVEAGEVLALLGPNGAGKSSALRAIAGLLPHEGRVEVGGRVTSTLTRRQLARAVAYVPQHPELPGHMTVADYVLLGRTAFIGYFGVEGRRDRAICSDLLDQLELTDFAPRRLDTLSGGELQRLVLARALAQEAPALLLDEPTSALDPGGRRTVRGLLEELRHRGVAVLLNSHLLSEIELVCDRVAILSRGSIVAEGRPSDLARPRGVEVDVDGETCFFEGAGREQVPRIVAGLVAAGAHVYGVRVLETTLEEIYLEAVGDEAG
jgi:ABC-type multidrug transport system ATPase subunit